MLFVKQFACAGVIFGFLCTFLWLSLPVQSVAWEGSSPKRPGMWSSETLNSAHRL